MDSLSTCANWESSRPGVTITARCCSALKWSPREERLCPLGRSQMGRPSGHQGLTAADEAPVFQSLHCGGEIFFQKVIGSEQRIKTILHPLDKPLSRPQATFLATALHKATNSKQAAYTSGLI